MTHTTPPGWYPDTGRPATERWWDGAAWTAHTRPLDAVPQQPGPDGYGPVGAAPRGFGPPSRPPARRGAGRVARAVPTAVAAAAAAMAVAVIVTAVITVGHRGGGTAAPARTSAPATARASDAARSPDPDPAPPTAGPALLVDQLDGITLPVPAGWEKPTSTVEHVTTMRTSHSYECPGDSASFCYHGTVTSNTAAETDLSSAEAVAKADIKDAADTSYDKDIVGNLNYDGITSHTRLKSESVTVAGRTGYLVRWRVKTGAGPGGYVQSVAFPSSVGSESMVVVRLAFDAGPDGPPLGGMDTITGGIRPIGDATNGGVGSSIGP
ncbi:DUF2510 domain-containing protein [Streptomyces sp. NBC_00859]|uniref:DUF2510 domain-containing protein n=1 Tax=Streptomyces sp. NBC_00859 TaxID=2903682 RepID=UPI00386E5D89|nr:DUF2510 domain-containing protein [Streptomyces sp. NBC_00859]